jgi:hypothetical protein
MRLRVIIDTTYYRILAILSLEIICGRSGYMKLKTISFVFFLLLVPVTLFAHPGRTDSSGGHYCWTNCEKWGYTYGQWHSHSGGSSYSTYIPTYKTNFDCPSYAFAYLGTCYELPDNSSKSFSGFTCDYGYDEVGYGLSKQCLPEIDNGYRIGSTVYCNYGYKLSFGSCIKKVDTYSYGFLGASSYDYDFDSLYSCPKNSSVSKTDSDKCTCDIGYEPNKSKDACKKITKKTNDKICRADFGKNSLWSGDYDEEGYTMCECKKGFSWNGAGTSCKKNK